MHELSIAESILRTVSDERDRCGWGEVSAVLIRIGPLAGVHIESLRFGFESMRELMDLASCELDIEKAPLRLLCQVCGTTSEPEEIAFSCSQCGSAAVDITSGYDLDIIQVSVASDQQDNESSAMDSARKMESSPKN